MQALVLAAGRGTRMGPLTEATPKPMLPVADRPLVAHVATAAAAAGADELVFTVGYGADQVRDHFGDEYAGLPVRYAEQAVQRGTADAVAAAADLLSGEFAVLNGDSLYRPADLERLFESVPRIGAVRVDDPSSYGVLSTADGVVTDVREKPDDPASDLVNAGAYAFPESVVDLLDVPESERGEKELTDVLDRLIERTTLEPVVLDSWLDVGRPWELLEANERRLPGRADASGATRVGRSAGTTDGGVANAPESSIASVGGEASRVHPTATVRGDVVLEEGVTVGPGTVIEGPVRVRSGCSIGPNASVRGATLLCEDVHVGHAVEVKNSVLLPEATVAHLSYVGDSVLGPRVNLGAGTQVANLRHDDEPVAARVGGERVSTGRRKFGAVLGPDVRTGIQTGINAGVTLSAGTHTDPGEDVLRDR